MINANRDKEKTCMKLPPSRSNGLFSDINYFLLNKPPIPTLIKFKSKAERFDYSERIMQRLDMEVNSYGILNIHKIGIDAPAKYIFEELLKWSGDSTCWPNNIARVDRIDDQLENIRIYLFGKKKYPFGFKNSFFGLKFIPLFNLTSIRFKKIPDNDNFDNARYLLYKCSGGYPVGIFSMYVRLSLSELEENSQAQLFMFVGFNFYGKKEWTKRNLINILWESIHNRVTANIMNRLKQLCEWRFEKIKEEMEFES